MARKIRFNKPHRAEREKQYLNDCLQKGPFSGDGPYSILALQLLKKDYPDREIFLTMSGTHALELAVMLAELKPGEEVILPSFTFPSTANALLLRGVKPVFAEIDENNLCLDLKDVQKRITSRTKGIIPVHYAGNSCRMESLRELGKRYNLQIIEDAAQACGARYAENFLGGWGDFGCLSFHETKNISCGQGGALIINKNDKELLAKARIRTQKGTNRSDFLAGLVPRYEWVEKGSAYGLAELLAAQLAAQLEERELITAIRKKIFVVYRDALASFVRKGLLRITEEPENGESNYHLFYLLLPDSASREKTVNYLARYGIQATVHYQPLHSSTMGHKIGYSPQDLPRTDNLASRLLRLPLYPSLTETEVQRVVSVTVQALEELL